MRIDNDDLSSRGSALHLPMAGSSVTGLIVLMLEVEESGCTHSSQVYVPLGGPGKEKGATARREVADRLTAMPKKNFVSFL